MYQNSKLLISEKPLLIMPKLAKLIGLNESIVLQQLHYWLSIKGENPKKYKESIKDGYMWVYNNFKTWNEQFPFWSERTIRRTMQKLVEKDLIIISNYNKAPYDNTNWYTIKYENLEKYDKEINKEDYNELEKLLKESSGSIEKTNKDNLSASIRTICPRDKDNLSAPIP